MSFPTPTLQELAELLRITRRLLPKDTEVSIEVPSGTPAGTEFEIEVTPPSNHLFAIRYIHLITPLEVVANVKCTFFDGSEDWLLSTEQDENTDEIYDVSDWDRDFILLRKIVLYARTKVDTTADRVVKLTFSGGLVKEVTTP